MASFLSDYTNLLLIAAALISAGMLAWPAFTQAGTLPAWQAIELINRRNAIVVDVRSEEAYRAKKMPQSRHIPFETLEQQAARVSRNKQTPLLIISQTGFQGRKAKSVLEKAGYAQVWVADLLKEDKGLNI